MGYAQLLLSLATSAQIGLGLIPNPASGLIERNVAMARQTIDLLSVLEEKTRGNLTEDERQLQDELLYALRMQYVAAEQGGDLVKKG
ncbi:MAG: DUF1844 domain-containing protein [Deltaproteobacteria bacterium]|nr:DUF1844 domain-containing protein [Deltaproteobacteria bacterium]